ncbi:MAG: SWIM zinc finger family protein [Bacteroidales bacterium]|jgi:hypothetical protein
MNNGILLFNSDKNQQSVFLENLTEDDVVSCCEYKIFLRGVEYCDGHLVKYAEYFPDEKKIKATVKGGEKYSVEIFEHNNEILASCTCPYDDVCKHIVAVLMFILENDLNKSIKESKSRKDDKKNVDNWEQYLFTLDKNELIKLVDKYAPKSLKNEINNRNADSSVALKTFHLVQSNIEEIFKDEELLFSPSDFETSLIAALEKLKGFDKQLPNDIEDLILYIIENVNNAFDEGYLYIDNYSYEDIFESEAFCEFVCEFTGKLPFNEKIEFLIRLDEALNCKSYNTFEDIGENFNNLISRPETEELKGLITDSGERFSVSFISRFYESIAPLLNEEEKVRILGRLKENGTVYLIEFCELLISQKKKKEAYKVLSEFLRSDLAYRNEKLFSLFLDLSIELEKNISDMSLKAISKCPTSDMLVKIKSLPGTDFSRCKVILENKNPEELLIYFEKEQMFNEAIDLINKGNISEHEIFDFFKRNKKHVVPEAEKCFINRINKNLQYTGDSYYALIAESLEHLNKINPEVSKKIINDIRLNYKRRPKLMSLLTRY